MKKILICLVLAFMFIGIGVHAEENETIVHTVVAGENLHILAERFYQNSAYYVIDFLVEYNEIPNPDRIVVDTVLKFPPLPPEILPIELIIGRIPLQLLLLEYNPSQEELDNAPTHTVVAGDVLTNLVQKFYESSERYIIDFIARINGLSNADRLDVGMILYFPALPGMEEPEEEKKETEDISIAPNIAIEDLSIVIHQNSVWLNPPQLFLHPVIMPTNNVDTITSRYQNDEIFRLTLDNFMSNFDIELDTFMQVLRFLGYIAFDIDGTMFHVIYQIPINNMIFIPNGDNIITTDGDDGFIVFSRQR